MAVDKRRVRTAVVGHADPKLPLALPMEAIELDDFRAHPASRPSDAACCLAVVDTVSLTSCTPMAQDGVVQGLPGLIT